MPCSIATSNAPSDAPISGIGMPGGSGLAAAPALSTTTS
jgi:hypothetical protein